MRRQRAFLRGNHARRRNISVPSNRCTRHLHGGFTASMLLATIVSILPAAPLPARDTPIVLRGAEQYCAGHERTFHGGWTSFDPPVWFRIGVNDEGKACYAQLNVQPPEGVAPYELRRFDVTRERGGARTVLRYRDIELTIDEARRAIERRRGGGAPERAVWFEPPPEPALLALAPPPANVRERWYGTWRGHLADVPFRVNLRFAPSAAGDGEVDGRISGMLMSRSFDGWFHGEMLLFRWKNRHVGIHLEPGGDFVRYTDYKGRVFRFERR